MTGFKIGDVVRLKKDEPERLNLVLVKFDGQGAFGVSECGRRRTWAAFEDCELVNRPDPQADLKQAIREVLLGDEFMEKFAAAFIKTPWLMGGFAFCEPKEPTKAQQLADRTLKAIWQANDGGTQ